MESQIKTLPIERSSTANAIGRAAAGLAGLALLVILVLGIYQERSAFKAFGSAGTFESEFNVAVNSQGDSVLVYSYVDPVDFASGLYPLKGDTVLLFGGQDATPEVWRATLQRILPPDTAITLTVRGEQGTHDFVMTTKKQTAANLFMLALIDILRFLIALGFTGVGLWAFFAQPNSVPVRVFAWFCFAMTGVMISSVNIVPDFYADFKIPFQNQIEQGMGMFSLGLIAFWLHLHLLFPRPLNFFSRHRKWILPVVYLPWVAMGTVALLATLKLIDAALAGTLTTVLLFPLLIWLIAGFVILSRRFIRTQDRLEKRQLRLVFWGAAVGLGGFLVLLLVLNLFSDTYEGNTMLLLGSIVACFSLLLLTPVSFAYAFGRYRLLEVQGKLKRGTRYLLTSAVAFTILFGIVYLFIRYTMLGGGTTIGPLLLVLLAFGVGKVSSRLTKILEHRFYPERQQLRSKLEGALERSSSLGDCGQFWHQLSENLRSSLNVQSVQPVLAGSNGGSFSMHNLEVTPFSPDSDFVTRLARERRPLLVDELVASGKTILSDDEQQWLSGNNVALVMPLMTQQRMTGFLALGFKTEQEDYAPEEISLLSTLAPQVALASENLRLIEENVVKRRLEEQMQMARRIQEGFLPRVLPHTPGLEIATHNRFSLDVAGDYFDVLQLPDGESLIAIADVSGKGAGAALLMANLQASLRTAVEVGIPLARAVAQVNNLIFRNTPPEQYITFVAVLYDPRTSKLRFVNAGHNPPQLIRANGETEELQPTGIILGAIADMPYEEESVNFRTGDVLVLYTDGVSEAMNDAEEEYGEQRINQLAIHLRAESAKTIVDEIEADVVRFCGRVPMEDDSTMVIVKRK